MNKRLKYFEDRIRTLLMIFIGIPALIVCTAFEAILRVIDPSGKAAHHMLRWYGILLSYILGIRIKLRGAENLDRKQPFLILVNHRSAADILVLARILPVHFKAFAVDYLFNIPFFGWCLSLAGYLPINRTDRTQSRGMLSKGSLLLKEGKAGLLIFPEGTRGRQNDLGDFKLGFLRISAEAQRPILPVVLKGTERIKNKQEIWSHAGTVHALILPPRPTAGITQADWDTYRKEYEDLFRNEYNSLGDGGE